MTPHLSPDGTGESPRHDSPGKRSGWLGRRVRSWLSSLLQPEIERIEAEVSRSRAQTEVARVVFADRLAQAEIARVELADRLAQLDHAHREAAAHLETRTDQATSEIADVRSAYLATRGEFETIRDRVLPEATQQTAQVAGELRREIEALRDRRIPQAERDAKQLQQALELLQHELEQVRDARVPVIESRIDALAKTIESVQEAAAQSIRRAGADLGSFQKAFETLQRELEEVRDARVPGLASTLAELHRGIAGLQALAEELRDQRLPAVAGRIDAVAERLYEEITATAGLVDRMLAGEPLRVAVEPEIEGTIPAAVAAASQRFLDEFRGDRGEIVERAREALPFLKEAGPVLDLGCGRGELLEVLREAGVAARGVDSDPSAVAACRRFGLDASQRIAVEALRAAKPGSLGGVTAIHLVEHLPAAVWMELVEAAAKALRPGGVLLVESPNPDALRVIGGLYWTDPTHRHPVHPQALAFVARAVGLEVSEIRYLRPFPPDESLVRPGQPDAVRELASRLDAWLSPARDFQLVARKP